MGECAAIENMLETANLADNNITEVSLWDNSSVQKANVTYWFPAQVWNILKCTTA